jgi:hypothetical protein
VSYVKIDEAIFSFALKTLPNIFDTKKYILLISSIKALTDNCVLSVNLIQGEIFMELIPGLGNVLSKVKAIESKIESISLNFQMMDPPSFDFRSFQKPDFHNTLEGAREKIAYALKKEKNLQFDSPEIIEGDELPESNELNLPDSLISLIKSDPKNEKCDRLLDLIKDIREGKQKEDIDKKLAQSSDWPSISPRAARKKLNAYILPDSLKSLMDSQDPSKSGTQGSDWLSSLANEKPSKIVSFDNYSMQAKTAKKFRDLKDLIKKAFPNRGIYITSTMGGRHISPAHPAGKAVDFVVDGLTISESKKIASIAKDLGFHVFNEYIYNSPYKTGDHMHVEL